MCLVGEDKNNGNLHNPYKRLHSPFLLSSLSCNVRPLPLLLMGTYRSFLSQSREENPSPTSSLSSSRHVHPRVPRSGKSHMYLVTARSTTSLPPSLYVSYTLHYMYLTLPFYSYSFPYRVCTYGTSPSHLLSSPLPSSPLSSSTYRICIYLYIHIYSTYLLRLLFSM